MEFMLNKPSSSATISDMDAAQDLIDTLKAHEDTCVGMAANMIGVLKNIIVFRDQESQENRIMFNPEIIDASERYFTDEGCLSLTGTRPTQRFQNITVRYQDMAFEWYEEEFSGFTAQIIQHEIDHCKGVVI